jgi:hypothetical protein
MAVGKHAENAQVMFCIKLIRTSGCVSLAAPRGSKEAAAAGFGFGEFLDKQLELALLRFSQPARPAGKRRGRKQPKP